VFSLHPIIKNKSTDTKIAPGKILEYLQHGKSLFAVALREKKDRWTIINQDGSEFDLPIERIDLLPGQVPESANSSKEKLHFLQTTIEAAKSLAISINLAEVWELVLNNQTEISHLELVELFFKENDTLTNLSTRLILDSDRIYFKKKKDKKYEPRTAEQVEELKKQLLAEQKKKEKRDLLVSEIIAKLTDPLLPLPKGIRLLEEFSALGKSYTQAQEAQEILEEVTKQSKLQLSGYPQEQAFQLLCKIGHFTTHENLLPLKLERRTWFSDEEIAEAHSLSTKLEEVLSSRQLIEEFSFTIDGEETKDFDDALTLKQTESGFVIGVHISDVSSIVSPTSLLHKSAIRLATSIYCPDQHFPMFPEVLSQNLLSLKQGELRPVLSFFFEIDQNFALLSKQIEQRSICVNRRLTYKEVDSMLCDEDSSASDLHKSLITLWEFTQRAEESRLENGATQFSRQDLIPVVLEDGTVLLDKYDEDTPARKLVSELMVLTNQAAAEFARDNSTALIFRTQEDPDPLKENANIPPGPALEFYRRSFYKKSLLNLTPGRHSGLGLDAYAQTTSPLRRAIDLLNQKQISNLLENKKFFYEKEKLDILLQELSPGLDQAQLISRSRTRYWILQYLKQEKLSQLEATVLRMDGMKPLCEVDRLLSVFPFYPKDEASKSMLKPGAKIVLSIESLNPQREQLVLREI
jgi:exoribonuclease II